MGSFWFSLSLLPLCLQAILVFQLESLVGEGKLCEAPYNKIVDWAQCYVFSANKYVVAKNHVDSNYKLAKDGLLSKVEFPGTSTLLEVADFFGVPIVPSRVHSINNSMSAEEAADEYEFAIQQLVKARTISVADVGDCPTGEDHVHIARHQNCFKCSCGCDRREQSRGNTSRN